MITLLHLSKSFQCTKLNFHPSMSRERVLLNNFTIVHAIKLKKKLKSFNLGSNHEEYVDKATYLLA